VFALVRHVWGPHRPSVSRSRGGELKTSRTPATTSSLPVNLDSVLSLSSNIKFEGKPEPALFTTPGLSRTAWGLRDGEPVWSFDQNHLGLSALVL